MRCGVCGDPWGEPAPRSNEMGGVYYKGIITRKYQQGNNWGTCENGTQAVGCGPQETFRGCADVSVGTNSGESSHIPVPVPPSVPVSQPTARFFKPFRPHYQVPKRKQSFSQLQPPLKSKPTLRPTHRPLYSSSTLSWEYWNSANAWPNTVSPGYPYGKPSTTTWFYHQWPATPKPTSRPQRFPEYEDWPSTPDLKTSPRPLPGSHGWTSSTPRYLYPSRRPIVHSDLYFGYPRPRFTSLSPHLPEQEWPSTFDLETSLRSHPERKPPHRKWNPEINDFPNDVSISLKSVNVPAVMTTSLATHPPTHLPTHPPTQPPPQSPTHSPPRPSSKLPPYLPLQPTTLPANKISTNRPVLVISLASG
ncbi:hypothetical protein BIW11_00726 [Tropilaelaps mercedesae]|uniref:Uncharacterized protein n=1 Tax=Tropilaelaps mercedesae TaxID=418985 RepID=A0A1V9XQE0_9ACAR|nr:hypothetical protein BIW11_00726 [Tropilaelaps mercedesae]